MALRYGLWTLDYVDLTLPTPAENLACDEALLNWAEAHGGPGVLRFWESTQPFVVLGYANKVREEVDVEASRKLQVPILRRCSGGGAVLQGPGCLNYSLVEKVDAAGPRPSIGSTNDFVMQRHARALAGLLARPVTVEGVTDLALDRLKFSGNAQRRRQSWFLFHGTFLLEVNFDLLDRLLPLPARQPAYRQNRSHADFLTRLDLSPDVIKAALSQAWDAHQPREDIPQAEIARLASEKYSTAAWNFKW